MSRAISALTLVLFEVTTRSTVRILLSSLFAELVLKHFDLGSLAGYQFSDARVVFGWLTRALRIVFILGASNVRDFRQRATVMTVTITVHLDEGAFGGQDVTPIVKICVVSLNLGRNMLLVMILFVLRGAVRLLTPVVFR